MRPARCRGAVRLELLLFGAILALFALVSYLAWGTPALEGLGGYPHDELGTLRRGGSGVDRHGGILGLGWAFGVITLLNVTLLVAFGARQGERLRGLAKPLIAGFLANAAVFSWMMLAYADYLVEPGGALILGFPLPSAILLYLFYPLSAIFNVYFVIGFRRWVLTEEDEARYQELVGRIERRRSRGGVG
jgi:hypothetical protein